MPCQKKKKKKSPTLVGDADKMGAAHVQGLGDNMGNLCTFPLILL